MPSWFTMFTNVFATIHSVAVDDLNSKCNEMVYNEFIEIICSTTLCQITQYLFITNF